MQAAASVRHRRAVPRTSYAVAPFVGDTQVARAIGRMVEVEGLTGGDGTVAAGAGRPTGLDQAGVLSPQGSCATP